MLQPSIPMHETYNLCMYSYQCHTSGLYLTAIIITQSTVCLSHKRLHIITTKAAMQQIE